MADYKTEPSELGYAAATTPLSDLGAGEPSHVVKIHDDDEGSLIKTTKLTPSAPPYAETVVPVAHVARSVDVIKRGQWSASLCGCFDFCVPNCCMATFCPCISAAQIASRVGYSYTTVLVGYAILVVANLICSSMGGANFQTSGEDYYSDGYSFYDVSASEYKLTVWSYLASGISTLLFVAYWQLRSKVRSTFELRGSCLGDCCTSLFCSCCSLAQMATHVKSYKPGSCDFGPPDELAAYDM